MKTLVYRNLGNRLFLPQNPGIGVGGGVLGTRTDLCDERPVLSQSLFGGEDLCVGEEGLCAVSVLSPVETLKVCVCGRSPWRAFLVLAGGGRVFRLERGGFLS